MQGRTGEGKQKTPHESRGWTESESRSREDRIKACARFLSIYVCGSGVRDRRAVLRPALVNNAGPECGLIY